MLVFAATALHSNLKDFLHLPDYPFLEPLGFAAFIPSIRYIAAEKIFADERRLLSVERELAIAREIQTSILPSGSPEIKNLRITAAYRPMTAVAGDFYEFAPVPAALIAAMIKVAMQSVVTCANTPPRGAAWVESHPFRPTPRSVRYRIVFMA